MFLLLTRNTRDSYTAAACVDLRFMYTNKQEECNVCSYSSEELQRDCEASILDPCILVRKRDVIYKARMH